MELLYFLEGMVKIVLYGSPIILLTFFASWCYFNPSSRKKSSLSIKDPLNIFRRVF